MLRLSSDAQYFKGKLQHDTLSNQSGQLLPLQTQTALYLGDSLSRKAYSTVANPPQRNTQVPFVYLAVENFRGNCVLPAVLSHTRFDS